MQKKVLEGQSSVPGAMLWMFGLSFLLTLFLGWVPFIGLAIGPCVGGYIGGRRAGTPGRAFMASLLPALLLSALILLVGTIAGGLAQVPLLAGLAALIAGLMGVGLVVHNAALMIAAVIGGWVRQSEPY